MAEAKFTYDGQDIILSCDKSQKMREICTNLSTKINVDINSLIFLYGESLLDLEKTFQEITKENSISIIAYKLENKEICPKCGRIVNNKNVYKYPYFYIFDFTDEEIARNLTLISYKMMSSIDVKELIL